jgi:hypothetical protein
MQRKSNPHWHSKKEVFLLSSEVLAWSYMCIHRVGNPHVVLLWYEAGENCMKHFITVCNIQFWYELPFLGMKLVRTVWICLQKVWNLLQIRVWQDQVGSTQLMGHTPTRRWWLLIFLADFYNNQPTTIYPFGYVFPGVKESTCDDTTIMSLMVLWWSIYTFGWRGGTISTSPFNLPQCPFIQMTDTDVTFLPKYHNMDPARFCFLQKEILCWQAGESPICSQAFLHTHHILQTFRSCTNVRALPATFWEHHTGRTMCVGLHNIW